MGARVTFDPECSELTSPSGVSFDINKKGKLYYLNNVNSYKSRSLEVWHKVLGHCNVKDILKLENNTEDMRISDKTDFDCKTCHEGKMHLSRSRLPDERAKNKMEFIHCDLAGPMSIESREKSKYCIVFVDDYSGVVFVYFLKNKSDALSATRKFIADTNSYGVVKRLRCDNGGEFTSSEFKNFLIDNKIKQEFSSPHSPHQNGTAERMWRTLFEMARCLLIEAKLPKFLWNYAVRAAAYIRNRCYSPRVDKTPFEMLTNMKPKLENTHIFGSQYYAYIEERKKLDPRCNEGIFLGYDPSSPAYLVYYPETDNLRRVRLVHFTDRIKNEGISDDNLDNKDEPDEYEGKEIVPNNMYQNVRSHSESEYNEDNPLDSNLAEESAEEIESVEPNIDLDRNMARYPERERQAPRYLADYVDPDEVDLLSNSVDYCCKVSEVPENYLRAISSPEAHKWKVAMDEEIQSLKENKTYDLSNLPSNRSVIGGRWVYVVKEGLEGQEQFKARYVAKGYSQKEGIDYTDTFSPTVRMTSVRLLMHMSVQENFKVHCMDFKSAYLNSSIDCEIYVQQPEGYVELNKRGEELVWKLNKSLYGLKQSGRNWNNMLHNFLVGNHFEQSLCDHCVYIKKENNSVVIILVRVDDLLIGSNSEKSLVNAKRSLFQNFKMKDLGILSWFLGIEFCFEENCVKMNQSKFIKKILSKFKMSECNPKGIPCDLNINKSDFEESPELTDCTLYRNIVGSLIYIMTCTRPDLSYVVSKLSQHMAKPSQSHLGMCKFVLKYLKGTENYNLVFKKSTSPCTIFGYCDSDWGGSVDRRSFSGYCFQLNECSSPISWKSKKQNSVALSSCEAEYISLAFAIQEAKFLQQLFMDMIGVKVKPINLFVDNQGAIKLAKNPIFHQRSKHIDIRYHFIRGEIQNGDVNLIYVPSSENKADMFTKPVSKPKLSYFKVCY